MAFNFSWEEGVRTMRMAIGCMFVAGFVTCMTAANGLAGGSPVPVLTSITGYSDGFDVKNGRYVGQSNNMPKGGSNRYKNFLASDSYNYGSLGANPYYWDINGSNFGSVKGSVNFGLSPSPFTSVTIVSWAATKIRLKVVGSTTFVSSAIAVTITTATGQTSAPFNDNVAGIIKGRGAGQCTWYVAQTRIAQGLSIPPASWSFNGLMPAVGSSDTGYRPKQWDCLVYPVVHVAIITTAPIQKTNADGSVTWTFTVSEYNATWNENFSTSTRSFVLSKPNSKGQRTVISGIGTNFSANKFAFGYYR